MHIEFQACLFDLDGTLINSIAAVNRAWTTLAQRHQLPVDLVLSQIHGRPANECVRQFLAHFPKAYQDEQIEWLKQLEATDTQGIIAVEGARHFLRQLDDTGIPWGIVTSCNRPVASARMAEVGLSRPAMMVTIEEVLRGKPAPEPYQLGAARIGVGIEHCVVFEDAIAGVTSAKEAGAQVVGVLSHNHGSALPVVGSIHNFHQLGITASAFGRWSLTID